jgi:hypothetical protein
MIMAQWRVMNAYDLEDDLPDPAPSPRVSHPLSAEEGFAANSLEALTAGAVLGRAEQKDG